MQCYWVVDPDDLSLRVWLLQAGRLVEQPVDISAPTVPPRPVPTRFQGADLLIWTGPQGRRLRFACAATGEG